MKASASKLPLLPFCAYWARDEVPADPFRSSEAADTGKLFHAWAEAEVSPDALTPEEAPLANVQRAEALIDAFPRWWASFHQDRWFRAEVPLLYDWQTGLSREMPRDWVRGKRERGANEIPAIIDLIGVVDSETIGVWDYKTGSEVGAPEASWQLLVCAVAACKQYGARRARVGFIYPRSRDPYKVKEADVSALDLFDFATELRERMASRHSAQPVRGDHCWRCNARQSCPALATRNVA